MKIVVLGAGNWGTTLSFLFNQNNKVHLWTIDRQEADTINDNNENIHFLPGFKIPEDIIVEPKYSSPINHDDIIILSVPSRKVPDVAQELKEKGIDKNIIVNVSKGVEHTTLETVEHTVKRYLPNVRFANLSGPTISKEIAEGLPAKAILASEDVTLLFYLQDKLHNNLLKFEFSRDIQGTELSASLKGLIAIAVGMADGFGFKTNVFGLIMTYGLQEFSTIMKFLGVNTKTVYGIAGMGDLITTCLSKDSRNRRFGYYLAQGLTLDEALDKVGMVVEGVSMAKTIQKLTKFNLSIPLVSAITRIIFEDVEDIKTELIETINRI